MGSRQQALQAIQAILARAIRYCLVHQHTSTPAVIKITAEGGCRVVHNKSGLHGVETVKVTVTDSGAVNTAHTAQAVCEEFQGLNGVERGTVVGNELACRMTGSSDSIIRVFALKLNDGMYSELSAKQQPDEAKDGSSKLQAGTQVDIEITADLSAFLFDLQDFLEQSMIVAPPFAFSITAVMGVSAASMPSENGAAADRLKMEALMYEVEGLASDAMADSRFDHGARIEAYFGSSKLDHLVEKGKGRTATWVCRMAIVIDTHRQQPSAASCSHAPGEQHPVRLYMFKNYSLLPEAEAAKVAENLAIADLSAFGLQVQASVDASGKANILFAGSSDLLSSALEAVVLHLTGPVPQQRVAAPFSHNQARAVKAAVKSVLSVVKTSFPGHLLSSAERRTAECVPIVASSLAQLLLHCDNAMLKAEMCSRVTCTIDGFESTITELLLAATVARLEEADQKS